jgi:membrane protease YdiL (CAAX protease family)
MRGGVSILSLSLAAILLFQSKCFGLISAPFSTKTPFFTISPRRSSIVIHSSTPLYYRDDRDHLHDVAVASNPPPLHQQHQRQKRVEKVAESETSSISMSLINSIWFNQVTLLIVATAMALAASFFGEHSLDLSHLHWNGMADFHSFFDWKLSLFRMTEGVLFAVPMIALGCMVENSDHRDASQVNFSTTNMVISLFGRRRSPLEPNASASSQVMMLSTAIALSTGISEELIFRGYIPTAVESLSHSVPLALIVQAVLFACGHLSSHARPGENRVVGSLQLFNGLWYGLTYLVTGGDLLPCIIGHILYDCHVLCESWTAINNQMDYSQESSQQRLPEGEQLAIERLQEKAGPLLNTDTIDFARRFFYAFDSTHRGSLSRKDTQRAVTYAFLNDEKVPDPRVVDDLFQQIQETRPAGPYDRSGAVVTANRIDFSQFLQVLMVLRSNAVR